MTEPDIKLQQIQNGNQTLFPIEWHGAIYYVRFVRRGSRLDCSGVFSLNFPNTAYRLRPEFMLENKDTKLIREIIAEARKRFKDY